MLNESVGSTRWNLLGSKTGTEAFNLPTYFEELLVIVKMGTYNVHFTLNIPRAFLESSAKGFRTGYSGVGSSGFCEVGATLTSVYLLNVQASGSTVTAESNITVYYR